MFIFWESLVCAGLNPCRYFSLVSFKILPICQSSEESTTHVFRLELSKLLLQAPLTPGGSNHTGISTPRYRMHIAQRSEFLQVLLQIRLFKDISQNHEYCRQVFFGGDFQKPKMFVTLNQILLYR